MSLLYTIYLLKQHDINITLNIPKIKQEESEDI